MKRKLITIITLGAIITCVPSANAMDMGSKSVVYATQQALNEAGFNCGTPDGISGQNTQNAIKQYQNDKGLKVDGQISEALLTSLGFSWDNPYGIPVDSFVSRYNESVTYFNDISSQSGDPSINQISYSSIDQNGVVIDDVSELSFGLNTVDTYIGSCILMDRDGTFDVKNLYELSSIAYAMDSSYSSPDDALKGVTDLFEKYSLVRDGFTCNVLNVGESIVFSFTCDNPNPEKVEIEIPQELVEAGATGMGDAVNYLDAHRYAYAKLFMGADEDASLGIDKKREEYIENTAKEKMITSLNSENATAAVQLAVDAINNSVSVVNRIIHSFDNGETMTADEAKKLLVGSIDDLDNGIISLKTMGDNSSSSEIQTNGIKVIEDLQSGYWLVIEGIEGDGELQQDNLNNAVIASDLSSIFDNVSAWFGTVS